MKKLLLYKALVLVVAAVGCANATQITIESDHPVVVYLSYGGNNDGMISVRPGAPVTMNTGGGTSEQSKIDNILWCEEVKGEFGVRETRNLDIPRFLAGATFSIGQYGKYTYNFPGRGGQGSGAAFSIFDRFQIPWLRGKMGKKTVEAIVFKFNGTISDDV